jgi:uncharacterized protein YbjT (DUF2867 family)
MAPRVQGRKIAFIGASGQLGGPTLKALLDQGVHTITAIQRREAISSFPPEVIVQKGELEDEAFLAEVLKGQDAVILMPPLTHIGIQKHAIRAAAQARVPYVLPSEFGPDPFAKQLVDENMLLLDKKARRDQIEELGVSSWVSITVGPWLDAGLTLGHWGIDPKARKATIWRGANAKANTATVAHTAQATAAVLTLPEVELAKYKNKAVYAPSWRLTQREILDAVQRATRTTDADWEVKQRDIKDVIADYEAGIKAGDVESHFNKFFVTHFLEGHGGDFEHKVVKADLERLEQLGLKKEGLEQAIKMELKQD